jgi:hypothetical protein
MNGRPLHLRQSVAIIRPPYSRQLAVAISRCPCRDPIGGSAMPRETYHDRGELHRVCPVCRARPPRAIKHFPAKSVLAWSRVVSAGLRCTVYGYTFAQRSDDASDMHARGVVAANMCTADRASRAGVSRRASACDDVGPVVGERRLDGRATHLPMTTGPTDLIDRARPSFHQAAARPLHAPTEGVGPVRDTPEHAHHLLRCASTPAHRRTLGRGACNLSCGAHVQYAPVPAGRP